MEVSKNKTQQTLPDQPLMHQFVGSGKPYRCQLHGTLNPVQHQLYRAVILNETAYRCI